MVLVATSDLHSDSSYGLGTVRYYRDEGSNVMYMQQLIPGNPDGYLAPILKPDGVSLLTYDEWKLATSS